MHAERERQDVDVDDEVDNAALFKVRLCVVVRP
jgi:hypothetical protein